MRGVSIIQVPPTSLDSLVSVVFNNVFIISNETEMSKAETVVWDFSNVDRMHPFMVFALSLFKSETSKHVEFINVKACLDDFLKSVCFGGCCDVGECVGFSVLDDFASKCYLPVCRFAAADDEAQRLLQAVMQAQSSASWLSTPLSYILGELVCNVVQHSEREDVFLFSFYSETHKMLNVCIADKGVGIYSSYVRANKYLDEIGDNDAAALFLANEGYSTKNLPNAENRGFGISTSKRMLVDGLGGCFCVMSGSALQLSFVGKDDKYLELPPYIEWQGTMFFLQIPCEVNKSFSYIDYLE